MRRGLSPLPVGSREPAASVLLPRGQVNEHALHTHTSNSHHISRTAEHIHKVSAWLGNPREAAFLTTTEQGRQAEQPRFLLLNFFFLIFRLPSLKDKHPCRGGRQGAGGGELALEGHQGSESITNEPSFTWVSFRETLLNTRQHFHSWKITTKS